jgi:hypothetical protein
MELGQEEDPREYTLPEGAQIVKPSKKQAQVVPRLKGIFKDNRDLYTIVMIFIKNSAKIMELQNQLICIRKYP